MKYFLLGALVFSSMSFSGEIIHVEGWAKSYPDITCTNVDRTEALKKARTVAREKAIEKCESQNVNLILETYTNVRCRSNVMWDFLEAVATVRVDFECLNELVAPVNLGANNRKNFHAINI